MNYNIILADNNGSEVKIRLKIPLLSQDADSTNSRWHAEGGKMKYANGTCKAFGDVSGNYLTTLHIALMAGGDMGVILYDFFSGMVMGHNQGGNAAVTSGWGGTTIVPGPGSWSIDD